MDLIRTQTLPLLAAAIRLRSRVCLDLAFDLLILPLSYIALNVALLCVMALVAASWGNGLQIWLWPAGICLSALTLYALRGWQLSGRGYAGILDLMHIPYFVFWKLRLMLDRRNRLAWVPTQRRSP